MRVEVISKKNMFYMFFRYEDLRCKEDLYELTDFAGALARKRGFEPSFLTNASFQQFLSGLKFNRQYAILIGRDQNNDAVFGWKSFTENDVPRFLSESA